MYCDVIIAGTGGQGILLIGNLLAETAMEEGREVTFLPSYGVEMRGGNANCTVVISDTEVGSPAVNAPQTLIAMSKNAQMLFEAKVQDQGVLILNSSLVPTEDIQRSDIEVISCPFNEIAAEIGNARLANLVALGLYVAKSGVISLDSLEKRMKEVFSGRGKKIIAQNVEAIRKGASLVAG